MREILISSSVMILLVMLFRAAFRGKVSHRLIYAMWLLAAVRLIVPVNVGTLNFGLSGMVNQVQTHTENTQKIEQVQMSQSSTDTIVIQKNTTKNNITIPAAEKEEPTDISIREKMIFLWNDYKEKVWFFGTCLILCITLIANSVFAYRLKKNRKILEIPKRKLTVYESDQVQVPCLYGGFHPAVYLPVQVAAEFTDAQKAWILRHEECHYEQKDHIWSLLRIFLTAVYWFHPLVWLAAYLSKKDAEISCDEKVLKATDLTQKIAYGKTLLCVTTGTQKLSVFCSTTAAASSKKELKNRMRKIVEDNKYKKRARVILTFLMVASIIFTFSGCGNMAQNETKNASDTSGKIENTKASNNDGQNASKQEKDTVKDYTIWNKKFTDFLKTNQKKYKLFSVVTVSKNSEPILLAAKKQYAGDVLDGLSSKIHTDVTEKGEPMKIKSGADVYALVDGKVKKMDSISCSSSGEWIHFNDGKVFVDTHHSLTGYEFTGVKWITTEISEDLKHGFDNEFAKQFFWNFDIADSVIFWNNTDKNRKKIENDSYGSDSVFRKRLVEGGVNFESQDAFGVVRDIKKPDTSSLIYDTNAIYTGENDPVIWISYVHNGKTSTVWSESPEENKDMIWSVSANVWDQTKWEQYYVIEKGGGVKDATLLRIRPATYSDKGKAGYEWQQFYLTKDGKEHITAEDSMIYDPDAVTQEDVDNMGAFIDNLWKDRLENATCLLSTYEYFSQYSDFGRIMYEKLQIEKENIQK